MKVKIIGILPWKSEWQNKVIMDQYAIFWCERFILGKRRNEYGKRVRKQYEKHEAGIRRCECVELTLVSELVSNTITTITSDNLLCVIDFINTQEG